MRMVFVVIGGFVLVFALIGFFRGLGLRRNNSQAPDGLGGGYWGSGYGGDHHGGGGDGGHGG
jgi:hypothetical protein